MRTRLEVLRQQRVVGLLGPVVSIYRAGQTLTHEEGRHHGYKQGQEPGPSQNLM